ncbi:hypothetical protein HBN50_09475 [Halobacteriovorax sp. GB3]|uniref:hypothetical protein n=1 Tax=Halobacteriovorax sp. GB3 TaxID=2719615 RepID=UPI00235FFEF2|nr:hypothetical protein [Halobacteriovorax sp. GB3]MDD0853327.1 hypothetical protein [Halobacteriovorax sp. GB3]
MKLVLVLFIFCLSYFSYSRDLGIEPEVFQREYIHTSHIKHKKIQTYGLSTCVALFLYDTTRKEAVLAHLDASVDLEKEISHLARLLDRVDFSLVLGGQERSAIDLHSKVLTMMNSLEIPVRESLYNQNSKSSMSLTFDLEQGSYEFYDEMNLNTDYRVLNKKNDRLKFHSRLYRHEESLGGGDQVIIDDDQESNPWSFIHPIGSSGL